MVHPSLASLAPFSLPPAANKPQGLWSGRVLSPYSRSEEQVVNTSASLSKTLGRSSAGRALSPVTFPPPRLGRPMAACFGGWFWDGARCFK